MLENECKYSDSVRILDSNNLGLEALSRAASYEKKHIELEPEMSTHNLSYMYAKRYARINNTMLLKVLEYMSDTRTKVHFLKKGGLFQEAFEIHVKQKEYTYAYRLASAQGWHDKGAALARKQRDSTKESSFTFQKVKSKWNSLSLESPELNQLHLLAKSQDKQVKAKALLLLGMLKKDIGLCKSARKINHSLRNKVGELEAFNAMATIADDESPEAVLEVCTLAQSTAEAFEPNRSKQASEKRVAQQASEFYGLDQVRQVYFVPPSQAQWLGMDFESCKCEGGTVDPDGMYRLTVADTKKIIASRFKDFIVTWIERYNLQTVLNPKLQAFIKPAKPIQQTQPQVPGSPATSAVHSSAVETDQALSTSVVQSRPTTAFHTSPYSNLDHPQETLQPLLNSAEAIARRQEAVTPLPPVLLGKPTGELTVSTEDVSSNKLRLRFLPGQPFEPLDPPIGSECPNQLESPSNEHGDFTTVSYQGYESVAEKLENEKDDFSVGLVTEEPDRDKDQSATPSTSALVDTEFCSVCVVSLCAEPLMDKEDHDAEGGTSSKADLDGGIETYQSHIKSKAHIDNVTLHKQFVDDIKWSLDPLLTELSEVVSECKKVLETCETYKVNASSLVQATDILTQVKDDSERAISEIKSSAEWRKGIETVNEYTDCVHSEVVRCTKELDNTNAKVSAAKEVMAGDPRESVNLDSTMSGDESDHEEFEKDVLSYAEPREQPRPSRTLKDKEKSRQRKKLRKK